jgi:hypothetical protein
MIDHSKPGAEQGSDHLEQQHDLDNLEEEAGIPTDLDNPRAPGGSVVKNPKGTPPPADRPTSDRDPAVG